MAGNKNTDAKRKYFALSDLILIGIVLCVVLLSIFNLFDFGDEGNLKAVVRLSGEVYEEIYLTQVQDPCSLTVKGEDGEEAVLYVTSDSIEFCHSSCPDNLCVNTGKLTKSGDSAVCLPLRISVELVSDESVESASFPDAIVG